MPFFELPTVARIIELSALRPEQRSTMSSRADFQADVQEFIGMAVRAINMRYVASAGSEPLPLIDSDIATVRPRFSEEQRLALIGGVASDATDCAALQTLVYLAGSSGQYAAAYQTRAEWYQLQLNRRLTGSGDGTGDGGSLGALSSLASAITASQGTTETSTSGAPQSASVSQVLTWV